MDAEDIRIVMGPYLKMDDRKVRESIFDNMTVTELRDVLYDLVRDARQHGPEVILRDYTISAPYPGASPDLELPLTKLIRHYTFLQGKDKPLLDSRRAAKMILDGGEFSFQSKKEITMDDVRFFSLHGVKITVTKTEIF